MSTFVDFPSNLDPADIPDFIAKLNDSLRQIESKVTAAGQSPTRVGRKGTYTEVTTDSYGRVTSGANPAPPPTTQNVVTGSRALGTTYQNTGTTPMHVAVTLSCLGAGGANNAVCNAITDSSATPSTIVASSTNASTTFTIHQHLNFWVLPGNYYKLAVISNNVALAIWTECA